MDSSFCFMCGKSTVAMTNRAVPICAECRTRRGSTSSDSSDWMVQRSEGRARGPMTREAVLLGLARGRIDIDDFIGRIGGQAVPVCEHAEFRACFIPGSPDEQLIFSLKRENDAGLASARRRSVALKSLGLVGLLCALSLVYVALTTRTFVLPMEALDEIQEGWDLAVTAADGGEPVASGAAGMPHDEWAAEMAASVPPTKTHWSVLIQQGRAEVWRGDKASVAKGRVILWQALASNPGDPVALGALVDAAMAVAYLPGNQLAEATRSADRARHAGEGSLVASRALGALALTEGNVAKAVTATEGCHEQDLSCRLIRAEAMRDLPTLTMIAAEYPLSARPQLAVGRVAQAQGRWKLLEATALEVVKQWPEEVRGWTMLAEACAATGRWALAQSAAERAIGLEPSDLKARHLTAAVSLWHGEPSRALDAYTALIGRPEFDRYLHRLTVLVQGGIAAVRAGSLVQGEEWAKSARAMSKTHMGAILCHAAVLHAKGEQAETKSVLREIDHSLLEGPVGARVHFWAGVIYLDLGQQRLARSELEAAVSADPHWGAPHLEMAWAKLDSGDAAGASEGIRELAWLVPGLRRGIDLRERVDLGGPTKRSWRGRLAGAMGADVRLAVKREGTLAVLDWYSGAPGARASLQRVVSAGDPDIRVLAALSQAELKAGDWAQTQLVVDQVLASRPRVGVFQAIRGRACEALGQPVKSASAFELALRYAGDHPTVLWSAYRARQASGDGPGSLLVLDAIKKLGIDKPAVAAELALAGLQE